MAVNQVMVLRVDDRNPARAWWRALDDRLEADPRTVPAPVRRLNAADRTEVTPAEARSALDWAAGLPGWRGGPAYAPHPLRVEALDRARRSRLPSR